MMIDRSAFSVDPQTHFPLVKLPQLNFAFLWLPISKIQIEYFLSDTRDSQFDRVWYRRCLDSNPRIVPELVNAQNLRQAFLTHISFYEARECCRWYGEQFDLPTREEWHQALYVCSRLPAQPDFVQNILNLSMLHPRAKVLVRACEEALIDYQRFRNPLERTLAHQLMFQRGGLLEYVYLDDMRRQCGACGSSLQVGKSGVPGQEAFQPLRSPDIGERMLTLGVRPILRFRAPV